jgi:hypothetical protein
MDTVNFTPHAQEQMAARGITEEEVVETIVSPDQACVGREGRIIAERDLGTRILRVIYNVGEDEAVVITAMPIRKIGGGR